jgi:hypothetical protein
MLSIFVGHHLRQRFPPSQVLEWSPEESSSTTPCTVALFRTTLPPWCTADTSPNEWTMHQRSNGNATEPTAATPPNWERYPWSRIALGLPAPTPRRRRRNRVGILLVPMIFVALAWSAVWMPVPSSFFVEFQNRFRWHWIHSATSWSDFSTLLPMPPSRLDDQKNRSLSNETADEPIVASSLVPTLGDTMDKVPTVLVFNTLPKQNRVKTQSVDRVAVAAEGTNAAGPHCTFLVARVAPTVEEEPRRTRRPHRARATRVGRRIRCWVVRGAQGFVSGLRQSSPFAWYH